MYFSDSYSTIVLYQAGMGAGLEVFVAWEIALCSSYSKAAASLLTTVLQTTVEPEVLIEM